MILPIGCERQRTYGLRTGVLDPLGQLPRRHALPTVDARLHPVELRQQRVGEIERAVREDVALDAAQDAERRELLVHARDLHGLRRRSSAVRPGTAPTAGVWSQIARYS